MSEKWLDKRWYISELAVFLDQHGKRMSLQELGEHLNRNDFTTDDNAPYSETHGRGVGSLVTSTYNYFANEEKMNETADAIARAFVKEDNSHAWDK